LHLISSLQYLSDEDEYLNDMFERHAKRKKTKIVTFSTEVNIEVYNSPYCDPTFMVR